MVRVIHFICRVFLLSFPLVFISVSASAYIQRIKVLKRPDSPYFVALFQDVHNLGSFKDNGNQLAFFKKTILDPAEKNHISLRILSEDYESYLFQLKYNTFKKGSYARNGETGEMDLYPKIYIDHRVNRPFQLDFIAPYRFKYNSGRILTTLCEEPFTEWMGLPLFTLFEQERFQSVSLRSVDPRFFFKLWRDGGDEQPESESQENQEQYLKRLGNLLTFKQILDLPELDQHIDYQRFMEMRARRPDFDSLATKLEGSIKKQRDILIQFIKERNPSLSDQDFEILMSHTVEDLLEMGFHKKRLLRTIYQLQNLLHNTDSIFSDALDLIALLEIGLSEEEPAHSVVIVGAAHAVGIEASLKKIGYEEVELEDKPSQLNAEVKKKREVAESFCKGPDQQINSRKKEFEESLEQGTIAPTPPVTTIVPLAAELRWTVNNEMKQLAEILFKSN